MDESAHPHNQGQNSEIFQTSSTTTPSPSTASPSEGIDTSPIISCPISALITTALVSILLSWAVIVVYFSFFPMHEEKESQPQIMAVDMLSVATVIGQLTDFEPEKSRNLLKAAQQRLEKLREQGVIVLHAGNVVTMPKELIISPKALVPGSESLKLDTPRTIENLFESLSSDALWPSDQEITANEGVGVGEGQGDVR